jgi:hypothetical protein
MSRIETQLIISEIANNAASALGVDSIQTVEIIERKPTWPTFLKRQGDGPDVLMAFNMEGYEQEFIVIGVEETDHYAVCIFIEPGLQVDPPDYGQSNQCENEQVARKVFVEQIVLPFAAKMTSQMTQEKLNAWIKKCENLNANKVNKVTK